MPLDVLWTDALDSADAEAYDRFVDEAAGGHYAQTRAWARLTTTGRPVGVRWFLAREGRRILGAAMVRRLRVLGPLLVPLAVVERGPVCAGVDDLPRVLRTLAQTGRRHGVARLRVMPYWTDRAAVAAEACLREASFRVVQTYAGPHAETLRMDLPGARDEELPSGSQYRSLRHDLKHAARQGATARRGGVDDVAVLEQLHREAMRAQGLSSRSRAFWKALAADIACPGGRSALFVGEHRGTCISAVLVMRHADLVTLVIGACSRERRPFQMTALPLMEAVRWARDAGCVSFDLGGVPMEGDRDQKRASIARFKSDFAKTRVRLVREHARWL